MNTIKRPCIKGLEVKEDGLIRGLIATTHPDRVGDILSKTALMQMVEYVNNDSRVGSQDGHYRGVSVYHDWIHEDNPTLDEAATLKPTAKLVELEDGHYGVEVEAKLNEYYRGDMTIEEIKSRIEDEIIGGFSIEYMTDEENTRDVTYENKVFRFIEKLTDFAGVAFARSRMIANPYAVIYKEIEQEVNNMSEEQIKADVSQPEVQPQEEIKENIEQAPEVVEEKETTIEEKACTKKKEEESMEEEEAEDEEEKKKPMEKEVEEPTAEVKETEAETKEIKVKEILESKEFKEDLNNITADNKVIKQTKEDLKMSESISIKEMNKALESKSILSFKSAASKYMKENGFDQAFKTTGVAFTAPSLEVKSVGTKLQIVGQLETKDIVDTESNPSTYTQLSAEFNDVFMPGLIDTFNNKTDTFSILNKEDHLEGTTHYGWVIVTTQDSGLSVDPNNVTIDKEAESLLKLRTEIKEYRKGIEVADYTLWHSRAGLGDLFMQQAELAMKRIRKDLNKDLFTEQVDSGTKILGFEAVADSTGNGTLYGLSRTAANRLAADALADTYVPVGGALTTAAIRNGITKVTTEGAEYGNLVIVTSPKQKQALFELLDGQQQLFTNPDFGFSGMIRFDGIPVIPDSDCAADALYIIDRESSVIVMSRAPQVIGLAKVAASDSAYITTYLAHVYKQPRRIHMLDTLS